MSTVAGSTAGQDAKVIGWVGIAHTYSHFMQLTLPPLFPAMKETFGVSYTALGFALTVFYAISGLLQTPAGFAVDRFGPRPVLVFGLAAATAGLAIAALATSYPLLVLAAVVAGFGNAVFHPADLALLNSKVRPERLGYAFSIHNVGGNVGWVLAPAFVVSVSALADWRMAVLASAAIGVVVTLLVAAQRGLATDPPPAGAHLRGRSTAADIALLRSRPVLLCFTFFFLQALALIGFMTFAPTAFAAVYGISMVAATSLLTAFLIGGIVGTLAGGVAAARTERHDWIAAGSVTVAAVGAALIAAGGMPQIALGAMTGLVGFMIGFSNPSRDILVRGIAPVASRGKVYGFVYSGLDSGAGLAPLAFGWLIDHGLAWATFATSAICLLMAIPAAMGLRRRPAE